MKYSIIIPVYNRPDELRELLESIAAQGRETDDVEVLVVEDGSAISSEEVALQYANRINVRYMPKENSGPGPARNYGAERATG
ncbi:MAG: glycosyltransferase family 2 protein, partial [Bacteroidaceae bacterium]|nr:glycosyltransferase family 2 protein [Bacteroidaceae bacterium]